MKAVKHMLFPILGCILYSLFAPVTPIKNLRHFDKKIASSPLAVAYLYQKTPDTSCKEHSSTFCQHERKESIAKNLASIQATAQNFRYKQAGINFLTVNLSKDSLCNLKDLYNLSDADTLLLFEKEEPSNDKLTGLTTRNRIEKYIEKAWGNTIDTTLKQQREERKQIAEERRAAYSYWGVGPYWCYPYTWGCGWNGCWAPVQSAYVSFGFCS